MCINTEIVLARGVIMSNAVPWSTWEELLLAYAVKRHGLKDWDKVATELQNRRRHHSPETAYTAQICRDRYRNLKRRFATNRRAAKNDSTGDDGGDGGEDDDAFLWLEELRKLRIAELKQEVHRYDDSIRLLQIKVKTMEEERGRNDDVEQPDLDDDRERSENDEKKNPPGRAAGKSTSGGENASFHESNSAGNRAASFKTKPAVAKPESGYDSSDTHEIRRRKRMTRGDVRIESEETRESSDVQSSASKRRRTKAAAGGGGASGSSALIKRESGGVKSDPPAVVVSILEKVRAHRHGLVFERRLPTQKTEKYKKTIRRHLDLETIQARMDDGSYSSCPAKFYVDLLLLFNNAIVFFPKASAEARAARDLRQLVTKEMKNESSSRPPQPGKPGSSDSLLARNKYASPIVVCRKRSSISGSKADQKQKNAADKPSASARPLAKSPLSTSNEDGDLAKLKMKEKPVTGVRSMRRGKANATKTESSTPSIGQSKSGSAQKDEAEASKGGDKKKAEATVKKTGAADFLKRITKNSPAKTVETQKSLKDTTPKGGKKEAPGKKKVDEKRDGPVRRSAAGGRAAKEESSSPAKRSSTGRPAKEKEVVVFTRKRGKDVEGDGSSQRDKKRPRQLRIDED